MELELVLQAVLAPAVAAAVLWLAVAVPVRVAMGRPGPSRAWSLVQRLMALLAALPVLASLARQHGTALPFVDWPPTVASDWVAPAIATGALAAAAAGGSGGPLLALACIASASFMTMVLVAPPGLTGGMPQLLAALACTATCAGSARAAVRPGIAPFAAWWIVSAAAAAMVLLSGFAKLALALGALSAGAAAFGVATRLVGGMPLGVAGSASFGCAFVACAFVGLGYDETGFPRWTWAALALSPAAMSLGEARALAARPALRAMAVALGPAAIAALALAAAIAASAARHAEASADAYGMASWP